MTANKSYVYVGLAGDTGPGRVIKSGLYRMAADAGEWEIVVKGLPELPAIRAIAVVGAGVMLLGTATLTFLPPAWSSHCGFRYCGRALGPSLFRSPFPVGTPSCQNLHMCANEYPLTQGEMRELMELMSSRGCEPP